MQLSLLTGLAVGLRCPPPQMQAATATLTTVDAAKIFGRLAENTLYLEKEVGVCCHSACSDCEWRLPDGGYRFDVMKASFTKWVPCYLSRDFEDERGCHTPAWAEALFPDGAAAVSREDFDARLSAMEYASAMGPKGTIKEPEIPAETLDALWAFFCDDASTDALPASAMVQRLQSLSLDENREGAIGEGPDSLVWKEFAKGLGAAPFERF